MLAKKILMTASGIPITSPDHPDVVVYWGMGNISGSNLLDDSPNGVDGVITGATSGTESGDDFLDFSAATDRVDPDAGILGGLTNYECVVILKDEDGNNGGMFEYDWEGGVTQDAGDCILLNEPGSSRVRFIYRDAATAAHTAASTAALTTNTKTVLFFGKDPTDVFLEFGGSRFTDAATTATTASGGESTLGNRDSNAAPFGGKIYTFVVFNRNLTVAERLQWEAFI
jgi:hypothetical protein